MPRTHRHLGRHLGPAAVDGMELHRGAKAHDEPPPPVMGGWPGMGCSRPVWASSKRGTRRSSPSV